MDRPDADPPRNPGSGFSLLRPAVPPRPGPAPERRPGPERPLGPFVAKRAAPTPPEEGAAIEELPWAMLDAPLWDEPAAEPAVEPAAPESAEPAPAFAYEAEEISLGDEAEWLEYEASAETPMAEDALEPLAEAAEPGQEPLVGEELIAPPEWEYGFSETGDAEPAEEAPPAPAPAAPAAAASQSAALEDVASRLEQIARSLRDRSPTELLSGAHDPLQVLIAGYALGLEAARAAREHPPEQE